MQPESDQENPQKQGQGGKGQHVKRADKNKQVRQIGNFNLVFNNPQQLYNAAEKYSKTFKTVRSQHPIHKQFDIVDFSLNARGPEEDQIYSRYPFFRKNIRRGNTFLYNREQKTAQIARKGLIKFFDISTKSLSAIKDQNMQYISHKDLYNHNAIFKQMQNVLSFNKDFPQESRAKVSIYRLNKANGQNAQISYVKLLDQWVICSKNVSILVKDANGIDLYKGERYSFANLIANTWFKLISKLNEQELHALKQDLNGKTIVGEYCGNPDFQHLVKYSDITIYFYAVVQANSTFACLSPPLAFQFLNKHKLPIVKNHQKSYVATLGTFQQIGEVMLKVFKEVSTASIFDEEQGSVIYFVVNQPKEFNKLIVQRKLNDKVFVPENYENIQNWEFVSSLGKLKTLEYRILRKLREKLKYFAIKTKELEQKKFDEKYSSFEKQCFSLVKNEKLSKPLEYYFSAGLLAMEYAFNNSNNPAALSTMSERYLDFISIVLWCIENKKQITQEFVLDDALATKLRGESWEAYNSEDIVGEYPQLLQKIVPKYAKIKKTMNIEEQALKQEVVDSDG